MNKRAQSQIVEWGVTAVVLLILLYVFYKIGQTFCTIDSGFCGYFGTLIAAFIIGIVFFLKFGNRK